MTDRYERQLSELRDEIGELEARNEILKDVMRHAKSLLDDHS